MKSKFEYRWMKSYDTYAVFDENAKAIFAISDYVRTLSSKNSKKNVTIALMLWFDYLDQIGVNFSDAETKHIPSWRDWLKTPPKYRDARNIHIIHQTPHIANSTWMQYQSRVSTFYEKYVSLRYPKCKISFKESCPYSPKVSSRTEQFKFREPIKITKPEARALSLGTIKKILACCSNDRDRLIIELFYLAGIRRGELFNLDIDQFKKIPRGEEYPVFVAYIHDSFDPDMDKQTKRGGREIYMPTALAERISAYIDNTIDGRIVNKNKHHEIFTILRNAKTSKRGDPIRGKTISAIFKRSATKAGYKKATLHDLRHSFVTNQLSMDVGIMEVMDQTGHKSMKTLSGYRTKTFEHIPNDVILAHQQTYAKLKGWQ